MKKLNLTTDQIIQAERKALNWYKDKWNEASNSIIENNTSLEKKELIDLIRDALMKN